MSTTFDAIKFPFNKHTILKWLMFKSTLIIYQSDIGAFRSDIPTTILSEFKIRWSVASLRYVVTLSECC